MVSPREYQRYLRSDQWRAMRRRVLDRDGRVCRSCGYDQTLHVHHMTYERFGRERLQDLVTLCEMCHDAVHRLAGDRPSNQHLTAVTQRWLRAAVVERAKPKATRRRLQKLPKGARRGYRVP